jgi:signal peptide peptidase SppA
MNEHEKLIERINLTDLFCNTPWLITEAGLRELISMAGKLSVSSEPTPEQQHELEIAAATSPDELARTLPKTEDGIAIINIKAPLVALPSFWQMLSGCLLTGAVRNRISAAADAPDISAIILDINSPGGQAMGIAETGAEIARAAKKKPVIAYNSGRMASAAYWLGSQASTIVSDPTSEQGSIGVVVEWADARGYWEQMGVKFYSFVSGRAPKKRIDVRSESNFARLEITALLDKLEEQFYQAVATGRKVTTEQIAQQFGQGGMLITADALKAKMIDRQGFFADALAEARKQRKRYGVSGLRADVESFDKVDKIIEIKSAEITSTPVISISYHSQPNAQTAASQSGIESLEFVEENNMTLWEKLQKALGLSDDKETRARLEEILAAEAPKEQASENQPAVLADPDQSPVTVQEVEANTLAQMEAKLIEVSRQHRAMTIDVAYADLHRAACLAPAQREEFTRLATLLLESDEQQPLAEGSRFDSLMAMLKTAPRHQMFEEKINGLQTLNSDPADDQPVESEKNVGKHPHADVLEKTPLGRRALKLVEEEQAGHPA